MTIGQFDPELHARYKKAKGEEKRRLLNQLLIENTPLIKILVDQFVQPSSAKGKHGPNLLKGGTQGFTDIPWQDAMQQASIAFCKAMDRFDSKQGKLPWYLKLKIRHELQTFVVSGLRTVRVPRGHESEIVPVALMGEQEELDRLGGSIEDRLAILDEVTREELAEWESQGNWPESIEELHERRERARLALLPPPAPPPTILETFAAKHLRFRDDLRVVREALWSRWDRFLAVEVGVRKDDAPLRQLLADRAKPTTMRVAWAPSPVRAFRGVCLRTA